MKRIQGTLLSHLVLIVLMASVPSLALLVAYIWQEQDSGLKQTQQSAEAAVATLASEQMALITSTKRYLQRLASFPEIQQPAQPACSRFLGKVLSLSEEYLNLGVPLPNGELVCNAMPMQGRVNVSDRNYFRQTLRTRDFAIGEFQIDRAANQASINFSYPVIDQKTGKLVGVAVAVVSTAWWSQRLAESDLPDGAVALVTDANGKIIAHHPASNHEIGQFAVNHGSHKSMPGESEPGIVRLDVDASKHMVYANEYLFPVADSKPFMVSVGLPIGKWVVTTQDKLWGGIFIILLIAGLTLTLAFWVMRDNVIRPINALLGYTKSLEQGSLTQPPLPRGTREIQTLLAQIISMGQARLSVEASLRESEARFRQIAETIPEVFWVVSRDWSRFFYVNPAYEYVWQKPIASLYHEARSWFDSIMAEDRRQVLNYINQMKSTDYSNIVLPLFRIERMDGTLRWISTKGFPIHDEHGEVTSIVGIAEDVTESKQYEAELSEREAKYRLLVENAEDLVVKVDNDGRFLFVSPSYCKAFGKSEHQLLGRKFMPLVHEDDQADTADEMKKLYYPPFAVYLEHRAMTVNGWRWLGWSDKAMLDDQDHVIEIIGVGRDITQQKTAEFALRESEARYRELVDNMSDGVVVYKRIGKMADFIIKEINHAAERSVGYRREQVIGQHITEVFPGVEKLGLLKVLTEVSDSGVPARHPMGQYHDRRVKLWVENYVFKLPSEEVVAVFKDTTAERVAADALRNSEKKFRDFFENLSVGLVIADAHADIIDVNKAFSDLLEISREEALGKPMLQLLGKVQGDEDKRRTQALVDGRLDFERFQVCISERSGRDITANVSVGVIRDEDGNTVNIYGAIEDVTPLVRMFQPKTG
jgi:PAS domain S-box-containing protein